MKKYIITFAIIFGFLSAQAQEDGYLIFKEYEPNIWDTLLTDQYRYFDINEDGLHDIELYTFNGSSGSYTLASKMNTINDWEACCYRIDPMPGYHNIFFDLSIPLNDNSLVWAGICAPTHTSGGYPLSYKIGLRYSEEGSFFYGWAEFEESRIGANKALFRVSRTCFCSIPDYPLRWGQTSLYEGVDDNNESVLFATIHPNPTTGLVRIFGQDLKSAEVVNMLGQRVATAQGKGETLQIDIAGLPAGVYFVRVTDEEGRKCVRKVVKE